MEEGTAGIGEAGALINRANAPTGMDITRGLQMADRNALKRAQLEAAQAAKKEAKTAAIEKFSTIQPGKFKDPSVNEESKKLALDTYAEMSLAAESGDYSRITKAQLDYALKQTDLAIKDKFMSDLAPDNKKVDTKGMLIAAREGKLPEYLQNESPLVQRYFTPDDNGNIIIRRPAKYDLNEAYKKEIKREMKDFLLSSAPFSKIKLTKKVPVATLNQTAENIVNNDENANSALDWDEDFKAYFKEKYQNDLNKEHEAKVHYVFNQLGKYNSPEYQLASKQKDFSNYSFSGDEANTKNYRSMKLDYTNGDELANGLLIKNKVTFGDYNEQVSNPLEKTDFLMNEIKKKKNVNVIILDQKAGTFNFSIEDPSRNIPARKNTKPLYLIDADGITYLVYGEGTEENYSQHIVPIKDKKAIAKSLLQYYDKDPSEEVKKMFTDLGSGLYKTKNLGVK